jgi:hypothetical protein
VLALNLARSCYRETLLGARLGLNLWHLSRF